MTIGERIEQRRIAMGITSQAELARRAKMNQSTLNGLIRKPYRWSPYLPAIARALGTTVAFLSGETDDPDEGAPPPAPAPVVQHVLLPVALPSEDALAQMFEGLLEVVDRSAPVDECARELAQLLPTALSQLRGRLTEAVTLASARPKEASEALATADHEPLR